MPSAKITSKGQITIPVEVRTELGLDTGDQVEFYKLNDGRFALRPRTGSIRDLKGCVPKLDFTPTLEQLDEAILDAAAAEYSASLERPAPGQSKDEAA